MMMKLICALAFVLPTLATATELKIGVVDFQRAIFATKDGQEAKKTLEADFARRRQELAKMEESMRKQSDDFKRKADLLDASAKAKKQEALQAQLAKYQESVSQNEGEMRKRQNALIQPIVSKLRKIVDHVAQEQKLTLVLDKNESEVLYIGQGLDLTERVVKEFENQRT